MFHQLRAAGLCMLAAVALSGCKEHARETTSSELKPREVGKFDDPPPSTAPSGAAQTPETTPSASALPAGHPPIGGAAGGANQTVDDGEIQLNPPAEWVSKPARMMTMAVYAAPKVEGDPEDADVAVSSLGTRVPLEMNVQRWCGQFEFPPGETCQSATKQQQLDGTTHPTTIIEMAGTYKGSSMFGPPADPKPNYKMITAEVVSDRPYYIKMVGPAKTVDRWRDAFIEMVKAAK